MPYLLAHSLCTVARPPTHCRLGLLLTICHPYTVPVRLIPTTSPTSRHAARIRHPRPWRVLCHPHHCRPHLPFAAAAASLNCSFNPGTYVHLSVLTTSYHPLLSHDPRPSFQPRYVPLSSQASHHLLSLPLPTRRWPRFLPSHPCLLSLSCAQPRSRLSQPPPPSQPPLPNAVLGPGFCPAASTFSASPSQRAALVSAQPPLPS